MSKNHRGKGIIEKYRRGRGTCPVCNRTGVKVIHEREIDKKKIEVCKVCNATLSRKETLLKKQAKVTETNIAESKVTETTAKTTPDTVQKTVKETTPDTTKEKPAETTPMETAPDTTKEKPAETTPMETTPDTTK